MEAKNCTAGPTVRIALEEISDHVLDGIRERLWTYTVAIFDVRDGRPSYGGTATCVTAAGAPRLLTAAHVWAALRGDSFALSLESDRLLIPVRKDFVHADVMRGHAEPEWGPDLAMIRLPDLLASELRNTKAFYDLDRRRAGSLAEPVRHGFGLWCVIGAPGEQSVFGENEALLRTSVFASGLVTPSERGGWDYLDLSFDHEGKPHLPTSYGGLSGSGLWQVQVTKSASTGSVSWPETANLEGVAFYQKSISGLAGVLRCHGRRSLFLNALEGLDRP